MEQMLIINYFFIYAILGWVLEVSFNAIKEGSYINCGVLNGPWCPIYGFAAIFILGVLDFFNVSNKLALFLVSMVVASIVEFITGVILEKINGKKWWDYSDKRFNLMGHICLEYSLMFGAVGFIIHEAIHPMIAGVVSKIPQQAIEVITLILTITLAIDILHTINTMLGINNKFREIDQSSYRLSKVTKDLGTKIAETGISAAESLSETRNEVQSNKRLQEIFNRNSERRIFKAFPNLLRDLENKGYDIDDILKRK